MKRIWSAMIGYLRITDGWLLLFWLFASGASMLYLWGIYTSGYAGEGTILVQAAAIGLGLVCALTISLFDYHILLKLWKLYLPICVVLMALTFVYGQVRGDNQAWISLSIAGRSFNLQPSELLKIAFITTLSMHIEKTREGFNSLINLILICLHGGAYIAIVQMQGDTGSALIFTFIFLTMIFCAGINWRYIGIALVAAGAAAPLVWAKFLSPDQKMRIMTLLNPALDKDYAFQQVRGVLALGVGGIRGTGIFAGKHVRIPEVHNDFIFSFIGEASGFIGCLGVIFLLMAIAFKIFYNSSRAIDDSGKFICVGVFAMIISQTFINIGMCLSLLPVIGVTLPLFSSGGSSVLALYLGLGMVLSVYCHSETMLFHE